LTGPSTWEQWYNWRHQTAEHKYRLATKGELEKLLKPHTVNNLYPLPSGLQPE